ncbi:MAG: 4Fe-4S dicluster domain-containing protein [Methanobacteriota archaeon]|nr:MAG: 4Fe-4S dicluster domain-containing protein [Euryarchaeota archaeon]
MRLAFEERGADYLLAIKEAHGQAAPVLLRKGDDAGTMRFDVPYQMTMILTNISRFIKEGRIAVVARRCDERAIAELVKRDLLNHDNLVVIGLACSEEQIRECRCTDPCPSSADIGHCAAPAKEDQAASSIQSMPLPDRLDYWIDQFRKCNKCFGCTLNCPVCFCDDCLLEEKTFTPEKGIPPGLAFHLIRAVHLADKCVECGECERSCPSDIPLLALRKMVNQDMKRMFNYTSGDPERRSPLLTTLEGDPMEDDGDAC